MLLPLLLLYSSFNWISLLTIIHTLLRRFRFRRGFKWLSKQHSTASQKRGSGTLSTTNLSQTPVVSSRNHPHNPLTAHTGKFSHLRFSHSHSTEAGIQEEDVEQNINKTLTNTSTDRGICEHRGWTWLVLVWSGCPVLASFLEGEPNNNFVFFFFCDRENPQRTYFFTLSLAAVRCVSFHEWIGKVPTYRMGFVLLRLCPPSAVSLPSGVSGELYARDGEISLTGIL